MTKLHSYLSDVFAEQKEDVSEETIENTDSITEVEDLDNEIREVVNETLVEDNDIDYASMVEEETNYEGTILLRESEKGDAAACGGEHDFAGFD